MEPVVGEKVALFSLRVASTLYLVLGIPLITNRVWPFINFASILDSYTSSSGSKSISSVGVAVTLGVAVALGVVEVLGVAEGDAEVLGVAEGDAEVLGVAEGDAEVLGVAEGVGIAEGETEVLGVAEGDAEVLGVGVGVGDATTTEAVPSKTKSVQFICESVV